MTDSKSYASEQTRLRFHHLPKALRDEIQSAIRIAWIDGHLDQIEMELKELRAKNSPPSQVKGLDL